MNGCSDKLFIERLKLYVKLLLSSLLLIVLNTVLLERNFAGPMPVGTDTMPVQGGPGKSTPEWAKSHPRFTTEQTADIAHSCDKDLHTSHCIKRCVKRSQHVELKRKRSVKAVVIRK